jgi:AbrB family looped-hinge helix DNA binding protein
METSIVKVTDKGQISIPVDIRKSACINVGDELLIMRDNGTILIKKLRKSDFKDLLKHSEKVANKLWDNKEDEAWNSV